MNTEIAIIKNSLMEYLRDSSWGFVSIVAMICLAYVAYRQANKKKILSYEVIQNTQLLTVNEELKGNLQVLFMGKPAKSLR